MKLRLTLIIFFSLFLIAACNNSKSFYIKNATKNDLKIIYDDRFYRSQIDTTRTLSERILKKDSLFFIGVDTCISNIWPDFLQINSKYDTIVLNGRRAIRSMINESSDDKLFITIH